MSSLVTQVSAGSGVVDGVNMVNPVLKRNDKLGKEDVTITNEQQEFKLSQN